MLNKLQPIIGDEMPNTTIEISIQKMQEKIKKLSEIKNIKNNIVSLESIASEQIHNNIECIKHINDKLK